jgi:hypothetical protein
MRRGSLKFFGIAAVFGLSISFVVSMAVGAATLIFYEESNRTRVAASSALDTSFFLSALAVLAPLVFTVLRIFFSPFLTAALFAIAFYIVSEVTEFGFVLSFPKSGLDVLRRVILASYFVALYIGYRRVERRTKLGDGTR